VLLWRLLPTANIRACRHGDRCSRLHNKPTISQTILIPNMYQNPVLNAPLGPDGIPVQVAPEEVMEHYEVRGACGGYHQL
jgi:splicing factor U2AF subunit